MHLKPSRGYEARDSFQPQSMRAPTHQPTSSWRPPSPAGPLAEIVGSGENITSPDCDAPTGQQKPAQLRRDRLLLHRPTAMYEATDNLRDTCGRKPDSGNGGEPFSGIVASVYMGPTLTGRRGPVSVASLGLLLASCQIEASCSFVGRSSRHLDPVHSPLRRSTGHW